METREATGQEQELAWWECRRCGAAGHLVFAAGVSVYDALDWLRAAHAATKAAVAAGCGGDLGQMRLVRVESSGERPAESGAEGGR